jgi:hypothetical protein
MRVNGVRTMVEIEPEYLRFFFSLFERGGGTNAPSNTDISASAFEDAGIEEIKATLYSQAAEFGLDPVVIIPEPPPDVSAELASLRAELDLLRNRIDGIEQL